MREYTLKFWLPGGYLHSYAEEFATDPEIEPRYTHRMKVLEDGTGTKLVECTGPPEKVEEVIGGADRTIDILVSEGPPTTYYSHFEPTRRERAMMEARRETSLAIKMPIELHSDGSIVATYVGERCDVADAFDLLPDDVEGEVLSIQEGTAVTDGLFTSLTERQRSVLRVAVEVGYYDTPRTATQDDVAEQLDITGATAGEHLRKIEASVLGQFGP